MPQPGQTFFTSFGSELFETEIKETKTTDDREVFSIDARDTPAPLKGDQLLKEDGVAVYDTQDVRGEIDPQRIHNARPRSNRRADERRDAEITTDPLQWASNPNEYDFPGVDTGPTFREEQGEDFDTDSFLDFL
jgi:hypothetical protein